MCVLSVLDRTSPLTISLTGLVVFNLKPGIVKQNMCHVPSNYIHTSIIMLHPYQGLYQCIKEETIKNMLRKIRIFPLLPVNIVAPCCRLKYNNEVIPNHLYHAYIHN